MAKVNLGNVELVDTLDNSDNILIESGGSVRRASVQKVIDAENESSLSTIASVVIDLMQEKGLGNAYVRLVNSDEGESICTINGESIAIAAGATYSGYVDDWSALGTNNLQSVYVVGDVSTNIYNEDTNSTLEELSVYFSSNNTRSLQNFARNCSSLKKFTIAGGGVTSLRALVNGDGSLVSLDLSGCNTSNVTTMYTMCQNCSSLTTLDLSGCNTSNVTTMYSMCQNCSSLTTLDLSGCNTSNVTTMYTMCQNCSSLTEIKGLGSLDTSSLTNMQNALYGCSLLGSTTDGVVDFSSWDISKVTSFGYVFTNCRSIITLRFGVWDMGSQTDTTNNCFSNLTNLENIEGEIRNIKISTTISNSSKLTRESALVLINGLYDFASEGSEGGTLTFSSAVKALLTDDDIKIATDKGWTIA